jgi:hypothetical protein
MGAEGLAIAAEEQAAVACLGSFESAKRPTEAVLAR